MDIFIQKNMLLDNIINTNEYVLSEFNSTSINKIIDTIIVLRDNLNVNDDMILLNRLIEEIKYVIFENNEYIKTYYSNENNNYVEQLNNIIYDLQDSINKINEFIDYLNSSDSLSELMNELVL